MREAIGVLGICYRVFCDSAGGGGDAFGFI